MRTYKASITYTANGTQKVFSIPFDYLRPLFIKVYLNETLMSYGNDYLVANREVRFTVAPPSGAVFEIRRVTDTLPLVSWHDASVLRSSDMTLTQMQNLHILEELEDEVYRLGMTYSEALKAWDGQSRRITNVLAPIEPQDVVTLQYIEDVRAGYISEMSKLLEATELNAAKAKASEIAAKASETSATNQADRAQGIADSLEEHSFLKGLATSAEAKQGLVDDKIMTPLKTKEAIEAQTQGKADLVEGKVPTEQLPEGIALLNSPSFSGTPTAPTAAKTVNTTQLATTAFVHLLAGAANNGGIVDSLLAQNGYVKFANGLIKQWGVVRSGALTHGDNYTVTFPTPFSQVCFHAIPFCENSQVSTNAGAGVAFTGQKTTISATFQWGWTQGGTHDADLVYIAIGL